MKMINAICEWLWTHMSAIVATTMVIYIGLCNPFVTDKFQSIYKYPVTPLAAFGWDVVFIVIAAIMIIAERVLSKTEK